MQQTEHCGLNQWELTDRILMSDFNADNARIDTALGELDGSVEELESRKFRWQKAYQTPNPCKLLNTNFSGMDWNQFSRVHFVFNVYTTAACTLRINVYTCRNADTLQVPASSTPRRTLVHVTLFPGRRGQDLAWATIACEDHCVTRAFDFPFQNITISSVETQNNDILPNSTVSIYTEG